MELEYYILIALILFAIYYYNLPIEKFATSGGTIQQLLSTSVPDINSIDGFVCDSCSRRKRMN